MTIEQQHAILDKTYKQLTEFCGKPPRGSVAPWWEASQEGAELMLKYGIEYGRYVIPLDKLPKLHSQPRETKKNKKTTLSPTKTAIPTGSVLATPLRQSITASTPPIGCIPSSLVHRPHWWKSQQIGILTISRQ